MRENYTGTVPYRRVNEYLSGALMSTLRSLLEGKEDWDPGQVAAWFTDMAMNGLGAQLSIQTRLSSQ
jgi:hypothetical protein